MPSHMLHTHTGGIGAPRAPKDCAAAELKLEMAAEEGGKLQVCVVWCVWMAGLAWMHARLFDSCLSRASRSPSRSHALLPPPPR
jgi:hypothetical protein